MKRDRLLAIALLLCAAMSWSACDDDSTSSESGCGGKGITRGAMSTPPSRRDLTHREDVLYNIETAYNSRRIIWYVELLDANFSFFLAPGDVGGGLPESWSRADEIDVNTKLFDKNYADLPCQRIEMDIRVEDGISWAEFDSPTTPGEKWYQATLFYDFKFDIAPNTYIPGPGASAVFTVRDLGKDECYDHHWQLVELRDLGGELSASYNVITTQAATLGAVKSLYR